MRAEFRASWAVAIVIATALVWAPNAFAGDGIRTYPTCVAFEHRPDRDATCVQGDAWGGVLIAKREDLRYKLCVRGPGDDDCKRKKARQGKPSPVAFFRDTVGTYSLEVEGRWAGARQGPSSGAVGGRISERAPSGRDVFARRSGTVSRDAVSKETGARLLP